MPANEGRYHSFLLRLWSTGSLGDVRWSMLLEDTGTGARYGFTSLAELVAFLRATMDRPGDAGPDEGTGLRD